MADAEFFDQIKLFLPKYLTPHQTKDLFSELSNFPNTTSFYLSGSSWGEQLLQGDGWHGFVAINFATGERKAVAGIILSNSCDIDPENVRDLPVNVLFSPLIRIATFSERLQASGKSSEQVDDVLRNIRKQRVTSIFHLPEHQGVWPESIVLLDNIHSHPLREFLNGEKTSLFTLNQYAFYLFLMKLSIHFARFNEGVQRFDAA